MPELLFFSPISIFTLTVNLAYSTREMEEILKMDLTAHLNEIQVPTLVLWGRHDGILPSELAFIAYDELGSSEKEIYIFEDSGHSPMIEEKELFIELVAHFVDRYN